MSKEEQNGFCAGHKSYFGENSVIYGHEIAYTKLLDCFSSLTELYNVYGSCQSLENVL